jgi:hypothetical protein
VKPVISNQRSVRAEQLTATSKGEALGELPVCPRIPNADLGTFILPSHSALLAPLEEKFFDFLSFFDELEMLCNQVCHHKDRGARCVDHFDDVFIFVMSFEVVFPAGKDPNA